MEPYETVRQALVADDFAAVAAPAAELAEAVGRLGGQLSAAAAGVPAEKLGEVRELLPEVRSAAASLAAAGDLGGRRGRL
jgi:hypothetical protein